MTMEIMPLGDRALLVNFEQKIDPKIHLQVMALTAKFENTSVDGITFLLPAYCSLTIGFDPKKLGYRELKQTTRALSRESTTTKDLPGRSLTLPVCYQDPYSLDLHEVSLLSGLTSKEVIELHTAETYQVYLLGFLPGFPYLGIVPEALRLPRKKSPRLHIPERSVGIAGLQTGIYPTESPGGWNILGSTPLSLFNSLSESPFLLKAGDNVKFKAISSEEYQKIQLQVRDQSFNWDSVYE